MLQRHIDVGQRLRLHALRRVHHEQRALAGGEAPRNLVGKIDVARRVDKVQFVSFAVFRFIGQAHSLRLDGDAAFALQLHRVEHLLLHLALGQRTRPLDQPVGQRGFSVIDMRDDGKIADMCRLHEIFLSDSPRSAIITSISAVRNRKAARTGRRKKGRAARPYQLARF